MYLCSAEYNPGREHTNAATDPQIAINWPNQHPILQSERDATADLLARAHASGPLPIWAKTHT